MCILFEVAKIDAALIMEKYRFPGNKQSLFRDMSTLAETWAKLPGVADRGASGRLIIGPINLQRADLAFNWNIVGHAIVWAGTRPGIEPLTDLVEDFFHMTRMRGRPPASRSFVANRHVQGNIA